MLTIIKTFTILITQPNLCPLSFRQPFSFITPDVVEASCQCMLAQAEESERRGVSEADTESMIIEEFGRCLAQIIDMGNRTRSFGVHSATAKL